MHDSNPAASTYNGHMLRNSGKNCLFICCKQSSSTHFCHFLTTDLEIGGPCGFESLCDGPKNERLPLLGALSIKWWAMRDVACGWRRPLSLRRFAPRVLRWKTLRVSSASHPVGFESLCDGPKNERLPLPGALSIKWWAMRDSNPQPCACKAPALTVAPIARRD